MITTTQLEGFNRSRKIIEYATASIDKIHRKYELQSEHLQKLEDWIQSSSMIINGVTSRQFEEETLTSIRTHCDEKVLKLFQDAIAKKDIEIVTKYSTQKGFLGKIRHFFSNKK